MRRLPGIFATLGLPEPVFDPAAPPIPQHETPEEAAVRRGVNAQKRREIFDRQVPARYRGASMADLPPAVYGPAARWLDGPSRTLVITGSVGVGKTHTAFAVAAQAVANGLTVAAWTVPDLVVDLAPDGDPDAAGWVRRADLLVLDDLATEKVTEWRIEQITSILDARLRDGRQQIVTANRTYDELAGHYGERIMSRLTEAAVVIELTGPDRRRTTW